MSMSTKWKKWSAKSMQVMYGSISEWKWETSMNEPKEIIVVKESNEHEMNAMIEWMK